MEKKEGKIAAPEDVSSGRSNLDADHILSAVRDQATTTLLEHIKQIVLNNPIEQLPSYNVELEKLINTLTEFNIDPSPLKFKLDKLPMDAAYYSSKMSTLTAPEVHHHYRVAENKSRLAKALDVQAVDKCQYEMLRDSLANLVERRENLRREQDLVEMHMLKLGHLVSQSEVAMDEHQIVIDRLLQQKSELLKTPVLDCEVAEALDKLKESLESQCKSFQDITL